MLKIKPIIPIFIIVVIILSGYFFFINKLAIKNGSRISVPTTLANVEYGSIVEIVKVNNAKLIPDDDVQLSFLTNGTVDKIFVKEGDEVKQGDLLMKLNTTELELLLRKTKNILAQKEANLDKVAEGTRDSDLNVYEKKKNAAEVVLKDSKKDLVIAIKNSYIIGNDSIRSKSDQYIDNSNKFNPELLLGIPDSQIEVKIESERVSIESMLESWNKSINSLTVDSNVTSYVSEAENNLSQIQEYLSLFIEGLNNTTLSDQKTLILTTQKSISAELASVQSADSVFRNAIENFEIANSELNAQQIDARKQDLVIAQEQVEEVKQQIKIIENDIRESHIYAPKPLMKVKKVDAEIGKVIQSGEKAIFLSTIGLKIQADIPEEDIGGIREKNNVSIILKSFPNEILKGFIFSIEENEIIKNENTYFRANISVNSVENKNILLRSGMTGDAFIETVNKKDVLKIPSTAVFRKDGERVVKLVKNNKNIVIVVVDTGISGMEFTEITDGLEEGQSVVQFP